VTNRRHKEYEAEDIGGMLRRMSRALVKRAAEGDTFALVVLSQSRDEIQQAMSDAARALHGPPFNYPWSTIGADLGITRQAAQQMAARYAQPETREDVAS
jgi:hypothetical protein